MQPSKNPDQATISKIFDPFFTTKFTGRGFGVAAVMALSVGTADPQNVRDLPGCVHGDVDPAAFKQAHVRAMQVAGFRGRIE